jgi:hypothetical protein
MQRKYWFAILIWWLVNNQNIIRKWQYSPNNFSPHIESKIFWLGWPIHLPLFRVFIFPIVPFSLVPFFSGC